MPCTFAVPLVPLQSLSAPHITGSVPVETAAGIHVYSVLNSPPVFSQFAEAQSPLVPYWLHDETVVPAGSDKTSVQTLLWHSAPNMHSYDAVQARPIANNGWQVLASSGVSLAHRRLGAQSAVELHA